MARFQHVVLRFPHRPLLPFCHRLTVLLVLQNFNFLVLKVILETVQIPNLAFKKVTVIFIKIMNTSDNNILI